MKRRYRLLSMLLCIGMLFSSESLNVLANGVSGNTVSGNTIEIVEPESETENLAQISVSENEIPEEEIPEEEIPAEETLEEEIFAEEVPAEMVSENDLPEEELTVQGVVIPTHTFSVNGEGVLELEAGEIKGVVNNIPEDTVRIPSELFAGNTKITRVEIPANVEVIEAGAFAGCTALTKVVIPVNTELTELADGLFEGCVKLQAVSTGSDTVAIPAGITAIGAECFKDCSDKLQRIELASTVKTIGEGAFIGCNALTAVTLGSVETIEREAFRGLSNLQAVTFPSSLSNIGENAFASCSKLVTVNLSSVVPEDGVLEIAPNAFRACGITKVLLPSCMNELSSYVFADCKALNSVSIANGMTLIRTEAFNGCIALKTISLPASVTHIERDAFLGCSALQEVILNNPGADERYGSTIEMAMHALPANDGIVVKGYGGNVEEWVGRMQAGGYKVQYESLYPEYVIATTITGSGSLAFKGADGKKISKVRAGDVVTVTATAQSGYAVESIQYGVRNLALNADYTFTVTSADVNSRGEVMVTAKFVTAGTTKYDNLLVYNSDGDVLGVYSKNSPTINMILPSVWSSTTLRITDLEENEIGNWAWKFTSNYPEIVSVSPEGVIRAISKPTYNTDLQGKVKITAQLVANPEIVITFACEVMENAALGAIVGETCVDTNGRLRHQEEPEDGMEVYWFNEAWVEAAVSAGLTRDINVTIDTVKETALDENGNILESIFREDGAIRSEYLIDTNLKWTSSDTSVVTIVNSNTSNNRNVLKVCGVGESVITVAPANKADKDVPSYQFVVRVLDLTPRLVEKSITINLQSSYAAELTLLPVYGSSLTDLTVVKKSKGVWKEQNDYYAMITGEVNGGYAVDFSLYENASYRLANKTGTVKGLYIQCSTGEGDYSYVKLPDVKITNKKPSPTVTLSGKINKFYTADAAEQTVVKVNVKHPNGCTLENAPYLENLNNEKEADRYFTDNFEVTTNEAGEIYISRKESAVQLLPVSKPSVSGYLCLDYVEYTNPVKVKVTVTVENKKPSYAITPQSVSAHVKAYGQVFEVQLIDSKTKEVQELDNFTVAFSGGSSTGIFDQSQIGNQAATEIDSDNDVILVRLPEQRYISSSSKAVLRLQHCDWTEAVNYTLTVKPNKAVPKMVLSSSTIGINRTTYDRNSVTAGLNVGDAAITDIVFVPVNRNANTNKLALNYVDGKIIASILDESVANGTYSFYATPSIQYENSQIPATLGKTTVKVKVEAKIPYVSLKTNSFKLNSYFVTGVGPAREVLTSAITWKDLTAEGSFGQVPDAAEAVVYVNGVENNSSFNIGFDEETGALQVSMQNNLPTGTYNVEIRGLQAVSENEISVVMKPLKITVKVYNTRPAVKLKASGKINVLNEASRVTYTPSISDFSGGISEVYVSGELIDDRWVLGSENAAQYHFCAELDDKGKILLGINPDNASTIESGTYKVKLTMEIAGISFDQIVSVTPEQKMPAVKVGSSTMTFYKGVPGYTVSTTVNRSKDTEAPIIGVEWSDKVSANGVLRRAFNAPVYNNGRLEVTLRNPTLIKKGTYKLIYAIQCSNQMTDVEGTNFTITVTVK